jgi:hypothetical protein
MTGQPLKNLSTMRTPALGEQLLQHLNARPWLILLDGLERVLVSYHRFYAAQIGGEDGGETDQIAERDFCAAIRPEDNELLCALAGPKPSKFLITSRPVRRWELNKATALLEELDTEIPDLPP